MIRKQFFVFLTLVLFSIFLQSQERPLLAPGQPLSGPVDLSSPDGRLKISFAVLAGESNGKTENELVHSVSFRGKPLVNASPIKLDLQGQPPLGPNMTIAGSDPSAHDDGYTLISGKASKVRDHYNGVYIRLEDSAVPSHNDSAEVFLAKRKFEIEARAYDDAVAFRYVIPEQAALREFRMAQEETEFRFAKDPTAYAQELPD